MNRAVHRDLGFARRRRPPIVRDLARLARRAGPAIVLLAGCALFALLWLILQPTPS